MLIYYRGVDPDNNYNLQFYPGAQKALRNHLAKPRWAEFAPGVRELPDPPPPPPPRRRRGRRRARSRPVRRSELRLQRSRTAPASGPRPSFRSARRPPGHEGGRGRPASRRHRRTRRRSRSRLPPSVRPRSEPNPYERISPIRPGSSSSLATQLSDLLLADRVVEAVVTASQSTGLSAAGARRGSGSAARRRRAGGRAGCAPPRAGRRDQGAEPRRLLARLELGRHAVGVAQDPEAHAQVCRDRARARRAAAACRCRAGRRTPRARSRPGSASRRGGAKASTRSRA